MSRRSKGGEEQMATRSFVCFSVCLHSGGKKSICVGKKEIGNENGRAMYREGGRVGSWEIGFTLVKEIFDDKRN